jgi:hypothetical protein
MNLLQIVQETRGRLGQPRPASVAGNTDAGIIQTLGLLNEFLEDLVTRKYWQSNTREATFTTIALESQGTLAALFPFGYEGLLVDTFFNRSNQLQVQGGLTAQEWASRKARNFSGPLPAFRIRGNELLLSPVPPAGHTYAVEYFSSYFIRNDDVSVPVFRKYWLKDTDTCLLDDALPMAYLKWAWKKEKGLDYAEDFRKYESMLEAKGMRDARPKALDMGSGVSSMGPGILVPAGSWNV